MKALYLGLAVGLVLILLRLLWVMILIAIINIRSIKIFRYFDNAMIAMDNKNENGLYSGFLFGKVFNKKYKYGLEIVPLNTIIIASYKEFEDNIILLDNLFILPSSRYLYMMKASSNNNYSIQNLIDNQCYYMNFDYDKKEIKLYLGNHSLYDVRHLPSLIKIKHIVDRYYKLASMKKSNLGLLVMDTSVLDAFKETIANGDQDDE